MSIASSDAGRSVSTWRASSEPIDPAQPVISTRLPAMAGAHASTSSRDDRAA